MDKIAFLILAHKDPEYVYRLVSRLNHERSVFYIHIDKKVDLAPFKELISGDNIYWVKRERTQWGSFGLVKATMNGLRLLIEDKSISRISLLSGQDYPIKPIASILDFFDQNRDTEFIDTVELSKSDWPIDKLNRLKKHYFFYKDRLFEYPKNPIKSSLLRDILNVIWGLYLPRQREYLADVIPYGGGQWFSFSKKVVIEMLKYVDEHPEFDTFHKYCFAPDEVYFQTILGNLNTTVSIEDSTTYVKWGNPNTPHPDLISLDDFVNLKSTQKVFARKLDSKAINILDSLDKELLGYK